MKEDLGVEDGELIMTMEEAFAIEIPDDKIEKMLTVKDAVEYMKMYGNREEGREGE